MNAMHLGMSDPEEEVVVGKTPGAKIRKGTAKLGCSNSILVPKSSAILYVKFLISKLTVHFKRKNCQTISPVTLNVFYILAPGS